MERERGERLGEQRTHIAASARRSSFHSGSLTIVSGAVRSLVDESRHAAARKNRETRATKLSRTENRSLTSRSRREAVDVSQRIIVIVPSARARTRTLG